MKSEYAAIYRDLYERHWWWRAREAIVFGEISRVAPDGGFGPILDVGCGDGLSLSRLESFGEPEGLETDVDLISPEARSRWKIHSEPLEQLDAQRLYGLITMLDVIEHVADDRGLLAHARSILAPGGTVVITVPALPLLWTAHDEINEHHRRYTRRSLRTVMSSAGFEVDTMAYFFVWLAFPKLVAHCLEKVRPPSPSNPSIPPRWINRILIRLSRADKRMWGRFAPFGSSLLAIGRRSPT